MTIAALLAQALFICLEMTSPHPTARAEGGDGAAMPSDVVPRAPRLPGELAQSVAEDLRTELWKSLGDRFVDGLQAAVKESLAKPKTLRESGLLLAIIPTVGAALIATGWSGWSHYADQELADHRRDYDQKSSLKATLDTAFEGQVSAIETMCTRATACSFQQLKRRWVLEPERSVLHQASMAGRNVGSQLSQIQEDISQSLDVEAQERITLEKAYEKSIGERSVASIVAEFQTVFDSSDTLASATTFDGAWRSLSDATRAATVDAWRKKLREAAQEADREAQRSAANGELLNFDATDLNKTQQDRRDECIKKADDLRAAYEKLAASSAGELRELRLLSKNK